MRNNQQPTLMEISPEEAMTGHGFSPKDPWKDAWQFILPSLMSKLLGRKTPWDQVEKVRTLMESYLKKVDTPKQYHADRIGLNATWPRMREMLRHNRGMTKLMLDHGFHSRIVYPYILQGAQAISLEVFFGRAFDLTGEFVAFPIDEMAAYYAVWEPIGVFIRERVAYAQKLLAQPHLEVLTCGAGFCPEYRLNDFPARDLQHHVIAVEADDRVFNHLNLVYGCDPKELGITYLLSRIENIYQNSLYYNRFDVVMAQGLISYYRDVGSNRRTVELLAGLKQLLKPGGRLICDLQSMEPTLIRCAECMGWQSKLLPDWTAKSAIRRMKKACQKVGLTMADVRVDSRNRTPCGVMFTLQRPEKA